MTIKTIIPENISGYSINIQRYIPTIKRRNYFIVRDKSVGGDAPKEFIKLYEFYASHNAKKRNWTPYIAKFGHKWYPNESITEHLIVRIGQVLGLKMADSKLVVINKQVRFLSRYFLNSDDEKIVHGEAIYSEYLEDKLFVEEIEHQQFARELLTFQLAEKAIKSMFYKDNEATTIAFVKMLFLDAIVGNNDRHFYNWGVVRGSNKSQTPDFSPIFDTARGLFWNNSDAQIAERLTNKAQLSNYLNKYIKNSMPKTGWEGLKNPNHIELVNELVKYKSDYRDLLASMINEKNERAIFKMIDREFSKLMTTKRIFLIKECLKMRFILLRNLLKNN